MRIQNSIEIPLPPAVAWPLLTDVASIASCLPGARDVRDAGDGAYEGTLAVKLGPVGMTFEGRLQFTRRDAANGRATVEAAAREVRNRGAAEAVIDFTMAPVGRGTRVDISSDITLVGQAAQYGRAAGMLEKLAGYLLGRFAACIAKRIHAGELDVPTVAGGE